MNFRATHWLGIALVIASGVFVLTERPVLVALVLLALGVFLVGCAAIAHAVEKHRD